MAKHEGGMGQGKPELISGLFRHVFIEHVVSFLRHSSGSSPATQKKVTQIRSSVAKSAMVKRIKVNSLARNLGTNTIESGHKHHRIWSQKQLNLVTL